MTEKFTDEHVGWPVVTAEGDRIGTIIEVNEDRAIIESTEEEQENLTDKLEDLLGSGGDESDEREIKSEDVDTIHDERIQINPPWDMA